MATVNLSPLFNGITNFDSTGAILAGGLLYTYQAGSSTPLATYTTVNGLIANTNPVVLGTDGKLPQELWLQSGFSYKFVLQTASSVIVNTYDNIAGILTTIPTVTPSVPTGCILIWSGSTGSIPVGFFLCDGNNGTPDLRNSFIVGAGNSYSVGQTGGSANAIVVSHTHTATSTVADPGHVHSYNYSNGAVSAGGTGSLLQIGTENTNTSSTGITVATVNQSTGTSGTNANLPPYYALAYIQKS
ncbi:hypothetical protein UFOVP620_10 [uncultured Caudovirales phage]|uniref:Phage tail collar domain containing protein n=1 Tax=uncultured Caudovirales phage TaxID=2100421 RepID=A0A6J5MZQ1_9CAUD|nr:hypothetical protein UFOVP620_10 [uncultured Caudovirales phage]